MSETADPTARIKRGSVSGPPFLATSSINFQTSRLTSSPRLPGLVDGRLFVRPGPLREQAVPADAGLAGEQLDLRASPSVGGRRAVHDD